MQVLKITNAVQEQATDLGIVVCWHGDIETGFAYTDADFADTLEGELVDIEDESSNL